MGNESLDRLLKALSASSRRQICIYLADKDDAVATVDELADHLGRRQRGDAHRGVARDARPAHDAGSDATAARLHHVHLPKLEALDVVEYDPHGKVVRYRGSPTLERLLRALCELEPSTC